MAVYTSALGYSHPAFKGYINVGKVRLGWLINGGRSMDWALLRDWRYAVKHSDHGGVRIPFPVTVTEWVDLEQSFAKAGITVPPQERELAEKSIENANYRFALSHATALPEKYDVPGLKGDLFGFQDAGVLYAKTMGWRTIIGDDMGLGKAQPLDAKILTPSGWKTMGEIRVGDQVIGSSGSPVTVTGVYPQGFKEVYEVGFSDGAKTQCCDEHLWSVYKGNIENTHVMRLEDMQAEGLQTKSGCRFSIPVLTAPVVFDPCLLPLDPYELGCLLGKISDPCQPKDQDMINQLKKVGLEHICSENVCIPEQYKFSSINDRTALLAGILSMSGGVQGRTHRIYTLSDSYQFIHDIQGIVNSLGGVTLIRHRKHDFSLLITLPDAIVPFSGLELEIYRRHEKKLTKRSIASATPVGKKECQCISVDALDHLYVTDDFILTHNTIQGLSCALASESKKVVVVTRAVAVEGWHRSALRFTDYPVRVACGIAAASLLKKTGSVEKIGIGEFPKDYVPLSVKLPKLKEGEVLKWDAEEMMAKAAIGTRGFDAGILVISYDLLTAWEPMIRAFAPDIFILDEAHAIKEPGSKRSKAAHGLMLDIDRVICLSGTPIPNRPKEFYHIEDQLHPGKWGDWYKFAHRYCGAKQVVIGYDWKGTGEWSVCPKCHGKKCKLCDFMGKKERKIREEKKAWDFDGASNEIEMYNRMRGFGMVRRMKDDVLDLMPPQQETISLEASKRYRDVEKGIVEIAKNGKFNPLADKKDEVMLHELFAAAAQDKIAWTKEWLGDFLEDTEEKIVVFFHHQVVGEALAEWLKEKNIGFVRAFGADKDKNVEVNFQTKKEVRVALCSYGVAREAVTLTEASYMLCIEFSWVPGWMQQAMDRIRRIGQERVCNYYFPVFRNSVEERIVSAFMQKQDVLSLILQGEIFRAVQVDI